MFVSGDPSKSYFIGLLEELSVGITKVANQHFVASQDEKLDHLLVAMALPF